MSQQGAICLEIPIIFGPSSAGGQRATERRIIQPSGAPIRLVVSVTVVLLRRAAAACRNIQEFGNTRMAGMERLPQWGDSC